jgi:hypothetical protein
MTQMKKIFTTLVLVALGFTIVSASSIESGIFDKDAPVKITIATDVDALFHNRVDPEYQLGNVKLQSDNWSLEGTTEIKLAGNSRLSLCDLPPLKIKLKKIKQPWEDKMSKVKVVLSCKTNSASEERVIKEYLSYRVYNIISPESYKVRIAEITITELDGTPYETVKGFILEPDSHLEKRVAMQEMKKKNMSTAQLIRVFYDKKNEGEQNDALTLSVFQFMIGNTDWNIHTRQNVKIFEKEGSLVPIPYDFDFSGLVNAPYAKPCQLAPIDAVTERFYQGTCVEVEDLTETVALFNTHRAEITSVIESSELPKAQISRCLGYVKQFYKTINEPKKLSKYLNQNCQIYGHLTMDNIEGVN